MLYGDVYLPAVPVFLLGMLAVELGIVCAIGVGVSARANRPLFAICVSAYLLVALLGMGTLIGYGLSFALIKETVSVSQQEWPNDPWAQVKYDDNGLALDQNGEVIADQDAYFAMLDSPVGSPQRLRMHAGQLRDPDLPHRTRHLAAGREPVRGGRRRRADLRSAGGTGAVLVHGRGDGRHWPDGRHQRGRALLAGRQPEFQQPCIDGVKRTDPVPAGSPPVWPLGLGLQALLAGVLVFLGRRRLVAPAGKLAPGTRIA